MLGWRHIDHLGAATASPARRQRLVIVVGLREGRSRHARTGPLHRVESVPAREHDAHQASYQGRQVRLRCLIHYRAPLCDTVAFCPQAYRLTAVITRRGNAFNPVFRSAFSIPFTAHPSPGMQDLIFLRLEVLNARGNLRAAQEEGKGDFIGGYAISLGALQPGESA